MSSRVLISCVYVLQISTKAVFSGTTITVISTETFIDEQTQDYSATPPVCVVQHGGMSEYAMSARGLIRQLRQAEDI